MSTSNSYNYVQDRDTIIRGAFEIIGVAVQGESLAANDITVANRVLNTMLKFFVTQGLQVWLRRTDTLPLLVLNQQFYDFGVHTVSVSGSGSTTAIVTHQNHGFSTDDTIIVFGASDGNFNVTDSPITVSSVNTYRYTAGGTVSTTESVSLNSNYTIRKNTIHRPERLLEVNRINSNNRTIMTELTSNEYRQLPDLTTSGTPIQFHYERRMGAGRMYIWPVSDASSVSNDTIEMVYQVSIQDMDASTDDLDMPQEWFDPVIYNLAYRLAPRYGTLSSTKLQLLRIDAKELLEAASNYDVEDGSLFNQPEMR